jgi:hypothetical protein
MHAFELCKIIKKRPRHYFNGRQSLEKLDLFLAAYEAGANSNHGKLVGMEDMRSFNCWVAKQLGYGESTSGWCNMILSKADSDEKAFDLFFELLDKYQSQEHL